MANEPTYDLELVSALDGFTAEDPELVHFTPPLENEAYEQSFDTFRAYLNDQSVGTKEQIDAQAKYSSPYRYVEQPYEQNPAPGKVKREPRGAKELSKLYREKKKQELADAHTKIAEMAEKMAQMERDLTERDRQLAVVSAERDQWKQRALGGPAPAGGAMSGSVSLGGASATPSAATSKAGSPFTTVTRGTEPLSRGSPFSTPPVGSAQVSPMDGVLPAAIDPLAHPSAPELPPELTRETLQTVYTTLKNLVENPDSTDDEIMKGLNNLRVLFFRRNYISSEYYDEILTPAFMLQNTFLNPTEEDIAEEPLEKRRRELVLWAQVAAKAGLSQEQFERFVVIRQRFKSGMRRLMRERLELHRGIRKFMLEKIGYQRLMNIGDAVASSDDVVRVAQLMARFRGNLHAMAQLRKWLVSNLDFISPRQHAICNLYVRHPTMYNFTALSAVTEMHLS